MSTERAERPERAEPTERPERTEPTERPQQAERTERAEPTERPERPRRPARHVTGMGGDCAHLAQELRELKAGTGLSLAALAERTPYSKSSWERYLNGKKPVPRQAVEALCAVAGAPCPRMLALWELADAAWSGRSGSPEAGAPPCDGPVSDVPEVPEVSREPEAPDAVRRRRWRPHTLIGVGALAGAAAVFIGLAAFGAGNPQVVEGGEPTRRPTGAAGATGVEAGCLGARCEGRMPRGMGCGQQGAATSLVDRYAKGGQRLEIRYSEVCRSMWVRASNLKVGDKVALYPALADEGEDEGAEVEGGGKGEAGNESGENGRKVMRAEAVDVGDATSYVVTPMTAPRDPAGARVCLEPAAGGAPECFDR
ncbi:helix-turn-helix domain-containing protein [Streptomyces sp. NPDC051561]|uniref:helix-turn-helix domain-containing protein n=1 Tax=Streptomyces sp. NPDC051561 TaxID=3365658 RepID=UPI003787B905